MIPVGPNSFGHSWSNKFNPTYFGGNYALDNLNQQFQGID